ncbi:iron-sulfur cluster co-chaperone protein HscB-like [Physella acuta]|uniref:iron-sulfur cluster co-chaperone protein HscB-like n=1 Tax=Physella acuta TaxID=109671 RepID=UPI0027DE0956|nr:iron-sulfur cluster co-chaperone protein HscB-like [Physella acuta]
MNRSCVLLSKTKGLYNKSAKPINAILEKNKGQNRQNAVGCSYTNLASAAERNSLMQQIHHCQTKRKHKDLELVISSYAFRLCVRNHHSCSKEHRNCWNCGRDTSPETELFFCDCGMVQKPANDLTYFDLMQLPAGFDIDLKLLSEVYKETQKKLHPDKFSNKSEEECKFAVEQSSLLNKAYNTLQKPLSRALYLLELKGLTIEEDLNFDDPEFLMEILSINEQISSAECSEDLNKLEAGTNKTIDEISKKLSQLFKANNYEGAKFATIRLRYYTTIQERIAELKRSKLG